MPAGHQIDCYLSCNVRIKKGELKKKEKKCEWGPGWLFNDMAFILLSPTTIGVFYSMVDRTHLYGECIGREESHTGFLYRSFN